MQTLTLGMSTLVPVGNIGDIYDYQLTLPSQGHYVFEQAGPGSCEIDVYGPFPAGVPLEPGTGNGRLKVCGVGKWGMRVFAPGTYLVETTQATSGTFSIKARQSSFPQWLLDAALTRFLHKSSC